MFEKTTWNLYSLPSGVQVAFITPYFVFTLLFLPDQKRPGTYTPRFFDDLEPILPGFLTTWNLYSPIFLPPGTYTPCRLPTWNLYSLPPGTYTPWFLPRPGTYTPRLLSFIGRVIHSLGAVLGQGLALAGGFNFSDKFAACVQGVNDIKKLATRAKDQSLFGLRSQEARFARFQFLESRIHGCNCFPYGCISVQKSAVPRNGREPHFKGMHEAGVEVF